MYEFKSAPPPAIAKFIWRMLLHLGLACVLIGGALGVGIIGYIYFEGLSVVDAFLNSAMLLGGMGPVNMPVTEGGKLFAGCYALFAGLVFIVLAGILFTPVAHRVLHKFHWDSEP